MMASAASAAFHGESILKQGRLPLEFSEEIMPLIKQNGVSK